MPVKGILNLMVGNPQNIREAVREFEFLLGQNKKKIRYASNETQRQGLYELLVGAHRELYRQTTSNIVYSRYNLRRELFYLWNLTISMNNENKKLMDYKLRKLADKYVSIIDVNGPDYKKLYYNYVDKKHKTVNQIEVDKVGKPAEETPTPTQ